MEPTNAQLPPASATHSSHNTILLRAHDRNLLYRNGVHTQCPEIQGTVKVLTDDAIVSSTGTEIVVAPFDAQPRCYTVPTVPIAVHYQANSLFIVDETQRSARNTCALGMVTRDGIEWVHISPDLFETYIAPSNHAEFYINGDSWNIIKISFANNTLVATSHPLQCIGTPAREERVVGKICSIKTMLMVEELGSTLIRVVDSRTANPLYTIDLVPDDEISVTEITITGVADIAATLIEYGKDGEDRSDIRLWHMATAKATFLRVIPHPFFCTTLHIDSTFLYIASHTEALTLSTM